MEKCPANEIKQKNLDSNHEHDGTYTCQRFCDYFTFKENIEDEPECYLNCPKIKNYIGKNNTCKQSCDEEDGLNFYELDLSNALPIVNYSVFECTKGCAGNYHLREYKIGNQCFNECTADYPYLSLEEHLCFDFCLKSAQKPFTLNYTESNGIVSNRICANKCINDGILLLRFMGKFDNKFVDIISRPGMWMQGLTTLEPDRDQVEVAIKAVEEVFDWRKFKKDNFK